MSAKKPTARPPYDLNPRNFRPQIQDFDKMQKQLEIAIDALCKIGSWTYGHSPASREHKIYLHVTRTIDDMYEATL